MRIAIPVTDGRVSAHFGHCEQFAIIDADPDTKKSPTRKCSLPLRTSRVLCQSGLAACASI